LNLGQEHQRESGIDIQKKNCRGTEKQPKRMMFNMIGRGVHQKPEEI
jgi:hypothetical protein